LTKWILWIKVKEEQMANFGFWKFTKKYVLFDLNVIEISIYVFVPGGIFAPKPRAGKCLSKS
jgi:hypothetical protein